MSTGGNQMWRPRFIRRIAECYATGSEVVEVVTDEGRAFAKFLGNKEGPHVLACEFLGTKMAALLGLPVFDHALLPYDGLPTIELHSGSCALAGPTWITRREEGVQWSGDARDLRLLENRADVAKLIVLDTWILNCDRFRPDPRRINRGNVFFSRTDNGRFQLTAMDHTHAFTCGSAIRPNLAAISSVKCEMVFGLFPEFGDFIRRDEVVAACRVLESIPDEAIQGEIAQLPAEWEIDPNLRRVLLEFLCRRRDFVASTIVARVFPQSEIDFPELG